MQPDLVSLQSRPETMVSCTFIPGARSLLGVEDTKVYPIRGQVVLVHAPNVNEGLAVFLEGKQLWHPYIARTVNGRPQILSNPPRQPT
jgi:hypothetical protein